MKKIISIIMALSIMLSVSCINIEACEDVVTLPAVAMPDGTAMSNATVTVGDESISCMGNSVTFTGYKEMNKGKIIEGNYEKVRFYLQLSPNSASATDSGYVRVIRNYYSVTPPPNADRADRQEANAYTLNRGEDAMYVELPMYFDNGGTKTYFNNLYIIFSKTAGSTSDGADVTTIMAGIEFITYDNTVPPKASIGDNDVATDDGGNVVSALEVKFSQKMDAALALPSEFTLENEDGTQAATVEEVAFDSSGKTATLTFDRLLAFDTEFKLKISENVKNDCTECVHSVDETTREHTVKFDEPTAIVIGDGKFYSGTDIITEIPTGSIFRPTYKVTVKNKYDLTPGGRKFTLVVMYYRGETLNKIGYDTATLLPGQNDELSCSFTLPNPPEGSRMSAFLLDDAVNLNAMADMKTIVKPISAQ